MKTKASSEIFSYWNDLRGSRTAPARTDINPSAIRHLLPDLFVLTKTDDDAPSFRLTGTRLYHLFHRDLREAAFSTLWQEDAALYACRIAQGVMQHERPVIFEAWSESPGGNAAQAFEILLLPLAAQPHFPPRLLGALVSDPPLQEFGQPFKPMALTSSRLLEIHTPRRVPFPTAETWSKATRVPF